MHRHVIILYLIISMGVCACNRSKIRFYISNSSDIDSTVALTLNVNGQKILQDQFKYNNVVPDYKEFNYNLDGRKDSLFLEILSDNGITKSLTIPVDNRYIFVTYAYNAVNDAAGRLKEQINLSRIPGTDSVILSKREIVVSAYSKMPALQ